MEKKKAGAFIPTFFVAFSAACWGIIGLFTRTLMGYGISAVQITMIRCIVTMFFMILYVTIFDRTKWKIRIKDIWMFVGTGVCSIVFFNVCYFVSISVNSLSVASVLLYTAPCFVMLMAGIFFHEPITKVKVLALILATIGCAVNAGLFAGEKMTITVLGLLSGLGAGFGYALYSIFGRVALKKYNTVTVTLYTFIVAVIGMLPFCHAKEIVTVALSNQSVIWYGLLLGIISTLIPYALYTKGLSKMEAGKASLIAFLEPVVATITGFVVFRERLTINGVIGIVMIFVAMVILGCSGNISRRTKR